MNKFQLLLLLLLTLTFNSCVPGKIKSGKINNTSQQPNTIVGTWRLIEHTDFDSITSKWIFRYGKNPRGYFTYTKSGVVNLNISTDSPIKISEDSAKKYSVNLYDYLITNSVGYFGTYTVNSEKSIVTHHVKGGSYPWYFDTDQQRPFIIKGDTLIITNNKTWKRVLLRVD